MTVTSTSGTSNVIQSYAYSPAKTTTTAGNNVDSSTFMTLMLAELTHQNPLEPMNNTEMMSQFSQLNSLQELRGIHTSMDSASTSNQISYAASLIGKTVKVNQADGNYIEGVVDGAIMEKGKVQLRIGTISFPIGDVLEIKDVAV